MPRLFQRIRDLLAWRARDRDMQQELRFHLDALVREGQDAGLSDEGARQAARRRFGNVQRIRERGHDVRGAGLLEDMARETRHAARRLRRTPAFTVATVATLALAIGANVAMFTVVHRVVLNPLPYPESERLILLDYGVPVRNIPSGMTAMTWQLYWQLVDRAQTLSALAVYDTAEVTLAGSGEPERIRVSHATPSLASVLGVPPERGRWFDEAEGRPGASSVAVVSYGLWIRRFGGDPRVLGQSVTIDGAPTQVVGVMPAAFSFPDAAVDVWMPAQSTRATASFLFTVTGVARLATGASVSGARAEITALIGDLGQIAPNQRALVSTALPLRDAIVGRVAGALWILLASVGLVLLVACANLANLFLVRTDARQREVAVRRALGSGRAGITSLFLAESLLLVAAGGLTGLGVAWAAVRLLVALGPSSLPRLHEIHLDGSVLALTAVLSFLVAVAFGVMPLLRAAPLAASLHESGRGNTLSRGRYRTRHLLMGAQVALALVLLVSSGLMLRSFQRLRSVDPGFDAASTLTFSVGLPGLDYPSRSAAVGLHQALVDRLREEPGVTAVSASTCLPLAGGCSGNVVLVEGRDLDPSNIPPAAWFRAVAPGYFEAMRIPVMRGRSIDRGDVERRERAVVVNEAFAAVYLPGLNPIGVRIRPSAPPSPSGQAPDWLTIVGVVANTATNTLGEPAPMPQLFMPMSIAGGPDIPQEALVGPSVSVMSYVVRTATPPHGLLPAVRQAIGAIDRDLALAQVRTLDDILGAASAQTAFTMALLGIAASVALLLGLVGIYGVVSYVVSQRTREMGVRLALGARPRGVSALVVRQAAFVILAGVTVGLISALAGSRLIESLLYDVSPRDPIVFAVTTASLFGVALVAAWLPARRAARVSPVEALRAD